jgi:hypothetical protein
MKICSDAIFIMPDNGSPLGSSMFFDPIAQGYCPCSGTSKHGRAERAAPLPYTKTPARFCLVGILYKTRSML